MKLLLLFSTLFITYISIAQAPEKMSYQAVIRDINNNLVSNQTIGAQISIIQGLPSGTPVYVETQTPMSNGNGLITLEIGTGQVVSGSFSSINWANGPFFLKSDTDINGGTNYTITGTTQLLSVPYALYAKTASNADTANFASSVNSVCPEDSMGLFSEVKDPITPPTVSLSGIPGIVDNRYYKYKYLFKKNSTRTKLSPESQSIQVINNTIDGQIDFSVLVPDESDIDSIVVYRQFSVDNIVFGLYSYVGSFPVATNQVFSFTDNNDNFSITPNPQPLLDTNNTFLKGIIKTDLLTENREFQLPDKSGVIALKSDANTIIKQDFYRPAGAIVTTNLVALNHNLGRTPSQIYSNQNSQLVLLSLNTGTFETFAPINEVIASWQGGGGTSFTLTWTGIQSYDETSITLSFQQQCTNVNGNPTPCNGLPGSGWSIGDNWVNNSLFLGTLYLK